MAKRNGIKKIVGGYELTHDGRSWFHKTRVCAESHRATLIDLKKLRRQMARAPAWSELKATATLMAKATDDA